MTHRIVQNLNILETGNRKNAFKNVYFVNKFSHFLYLTYQTYCYRGISQSVMDTFFLQVCVTEPDIQGQVNIPCCLDRGGDGQFSHK